jgi:hypothetical protein
MVTTNNVLGDSDILVFSERSGGVRDLLEWWCEGLDTDGQDWVQAWGTTWDPEFFLWSKNAETLKEEGNPALQAFIQKEGVTEKAKVLTEWATQLEKPCTLFIRHLTALDSTNAMQAAIALAVMRERHCCGLLRLVVADTFEKIYLSSSDHSGYWRFASVHRLSGLNKDAIERLAKYKSENWRPLHLEGKSLDRFMEQTGGQPLLVKTLLNRIQSVCNKQRKCEPSIDVIEQEARKLRSAPPGEVRLWQNDLRRLLQVHPELRLTVEIYLNKTLGPARFPPPSEERPLYIAGWLKLNQSGRWGITSLIHKDLARSVLDELEG